VSDFSDFLGTFTTVPITVCLVVAALALICFCAFCVRCCRIRDCACVKRLLRVTGYDDCDDFGLMVMVHEVTLDGAQKVLTSVRIRAGDNVVQTDPSKGVFQQPLHLDVVQGTHELVIDLLQGSRVVATTHLKSGKVLREEKGKTESQYKMTSKHKHFRNVCAKLTFHVTEVEDDLEKGMLAGTTAEVGLLVREQLQKARSAGEGLSEIDVLVAACEGPLETISAPWAKSGTYSQVYVSVFGPPTSRRYILGLWDDKLSFKNRRPPRLEVDLLKVQSVQADPVRHHIFVLSYFDEHRICQYLSFRRKDRARDVWVEILQQSVHKIHEARRAHKEMRATGHSPSQKTTSSTSSYNCPKSRG